MSIITLLISFLWLSMVFSFTSADQANIDCLKTMRSQIEDPNGYLKSWDFRNESEGFICKFHGVTCWHDDENRVLSINVSGYGLKGEFPLGFEGCSTFSDLDLSRNNFYGPLPSNISSLLPFITALDLSYNKFSGEVPIGLSNVSFLNTLHLEHNQFIGQLPPQLAYLRLLKELSVAHNRLTDLPLDACDGLELIRLGEIAAACAAAIFVPVGAVLGWFFSSGKKQRRRNIRYPSRI